MANFPPLFIVGAQRSGTTMLRLMLDSHSQIAIPFETDFIAKHYLEQSAFGDLQDDANVALLLQSIQTSSFVKRGELADIASSDVMPHIETRDYAGVIDALFRTWASTLGKRRWGDKTPGVSHLHVLDKLFPKAVFVHLIRDGRDVAVSRMTTWRQRSLLEIAHDWCWKVTSIRRFAVIWGDRYHEIRYEDLVKCPSDVLQTLCNKIGVPYESAMLEYHRTAVDRMPAYSVEHHHQSSIQPPDPVKICSWKKKMTRTERALFQTVAAPLLGDLQYELEDLRALPIRLAMRATLMAQAARGLSLFESPCLR